MHNYGKLSKIDVARNFVWVVSSCFPFQASRRGCQFCPTRRETKSPGGSARAPRRRRGRRTSRPPRRRPAPLYAGLPAREPSGCLFLGREGPHPVNAICGGWRETLPQVQPLLFLPEHGACFLESCGVHFGGFCWGFGGKVSPCCRTGDFLPQKAIDLGSRGPESRNRLVRGGLGQLSKRFRRGLGVI